MSKIQSMSLKLLYGFLILEMVALPLLATNACKTKPTVKTTTDQSSTITSSETTTAPITKQTASGVVSLPAGSSLALSDLRVKSCLEEKAIKSNGSFSVQELGNGVATVGLTDKQGKMVLVGYVDTSSPSSNISADTTAVWLLSKVFSYLFPATFSRADMISIISATDAAKQLAKVIAARVAANPTALADGDDQITAALDAAVMSIQSLSKYSTGLSPQPPITAQILSSSILASNEHSTANVTTASTSQASDLTSAGITPVLPVNFILGGVIGTSLKSAIETEEQGPAMLTVEGSMKSGVNVTADTSGSEDPNVNGFVVTNDRRRHLGYAIYRVGYVDANGEDHPVNPPEKITPTNSFLFCPAVSGYSGVIGTFSDALLNLLVNYNDMPLKEKVSLPVELSMKPADALKTKYLIVVTGPGEAGGTDFANYLPEEIKNNATYLNDTYDQCTLISAATVISELLIPLVCEFFPEGTVQKLIDLSQPGVAKPFLAMTEEMIKDGTKTGVAWTSNLSTGDYKGALNALLKLVLDSSEYRTKFVNWIITYLMKNAEQAALKSALDSASNVLAAVKVLDKVLAGIDLATVFTHINTSNAADYWDITAVPPVLRLDPNPALVAPGDTLNLKAAARGLKGTVVWRFSSTGKFGHLNKWDGTEQSAEFESSQPNISYACNTDATTGDSDEITAKAYLKDGVEMRSLGEITIPITIQSKTVLLNPNSSTVISGKSVVLKASVPGVTGTIVWRFSCSNLNGHLWNGTDQTTDFETSKPDVTYVTDKGVEVGTIDTITVEALLSRDGKLISQGKASATVEIAAIAFIDKTTVKVIPEGTTKIIVSLMTNWAPDATGTNSRIPLFTREVPISPGQTEVVFNDFGSAQYPAGMFVLSVRCLCGRGFVWTEPEFTVKLNAGHNTLLASLSQPIYILSGGEDPLAPIAQQGGWFYLTLNGGAASIYYMGESPPLYWFKGKPGDSVEVKIKAINPGKNAYPEKITLGPIWLHSWVDGSKTKLTDGGDFSGTFPPGNTEVYNKKFSVPVSKITTATTISTIITATATSPTTSSITTTTMTTTPSTTVPTSTATTPSTTTTTSTTTTAPSTTTATSSTTPPSKLPLTKVTIWLTTTNDSSAPHVGSLMVGTADKLYIWAQAPADQEGDFNLIGTLQDGTQTPFGTSRHASSGQIFGIGNITGYFLNIVGTIKVEAISNNKVVGSTQINITATNTPPQLTLYTPQISGLSVTINGLTNPGGSNVTISKISWDWGDGISEEHWFPASHSYSKAGQYTVSVTSYQNDGLTITKSVNVTIQ